MRWGCTWSMFPCTLGSGCVCLGLGLGVGLRKCLRVPCCATHARPHPCVCTDVVGTGASNIACPSKRSCSQPGKARRLAEFKAGPMGWAHGQSSRLAKLKAGIAHGLPFQRSCLVECWAGQSRLGLQRAAPTGTNSRLACLGLFLK